jgi:hypothetical protein
MKNARELKNKAVKDLEAKIIKPKTSSKIAWKGKDGKFRVIESLDGPGRLTVHSTAPEGATIVEDARAAFQVAERFYKKAVPHALKRQMEKDHTAEMSKVGYTTDLAPSMSYDPVPMSKKPPHMI